MATRKSSELSNLIARAEAAERERDGLRLRVEELEAGKLKRELDTAAELIEAKLSGWSWTFTFITNPEHAALPFGPGVSVLLTNPMGKRIWEKASESILEATKRAIQRADAEAGERSGE